MGSPAERLRSLEKELQDSSALPAHTAVQSFEEAIKTAIYSGANETATRLIDSYLDLFEDPVPYETKYFCWYKRATLFWRESRIEEADRIYEQCSRLAEENGDHRGAARCLMASGVIAWNGKRFQEALSTLEKAEQGLRPYRDETLSNCLNWLGIVCGELELYPRSWKYYTEALEMNEELGLEASQGYLLSNLGLLCRSMGLVDQAEDSFRKSIVLHERTGNKYGSIDSRANLAMLVLDKRNRPEEALPMLLETAELQAEAGLPDKAGLVYSSAATAAYRSGSIQQTFDLFDIAEKNLIEADAWNYLMEMHSRKAGILMELDRYAEAEEEVQKARAIHSRHTDESGESGLLKLESELAYEQGDFEKAYTLLHKSCSVENRLEATRSAALQDVIGMITESARKEQELQEARHRTALLEERNAALSASERRFRQIVDRMTGIGVLAVDVSGRITFWNSSCAALYGYSAEEATGRRPDELIVPEGSADLFNSVLNSCRSGVSTEITLTTSEGAQRQMQISAIPLLTGETFLAQVDLTCQREAELQRKKIEAQLRRTQKLEALGTLAGGVAHDFNNLLQGILANSSILCDALSDSPEVLGYAELITRAAERSAELCVQMLDYAGVTPVGHEVLDMNSLVEEMTALLKTSFPKNVTFLLNPSSNIPMVVGDMSQIRQIVMNLALNGAEAIQGPGTVTISTERIHMNTCDFTGNLLEETPPPGDYLCLKVTDDGAGIDSDTLARIFDPFFSTKRTGRGLGLAAVLGIIRAHGGAITVNTTLGRGTEFSVYLRAAAVQTVKPDSRSAEKIVPLDGRSILIVDDEEIVRETLEAILSSMGCRSASVSGGAEALEYLDSCPDTTDAVILDLTMPGMNGVDVFRIMQDRKHLIPVLMISGYTRDKLESVFGSDVPAGFLQKPFTPSQLRMSLSSLLHR